jgi:hypothetical protein
MKKGTTAIFTVLAVLALTAAAFAGTIQVVNATGFAIQEMYISDSGTDDWEEDLLGDEVLENGDILTIQVDGSYEQFDLAAVAPDGAQASWTGLPGGAKKITLHRDATADVQ